MSARVIANIHCTLHCNPGPRASRVQLYTASLARFAVSYHEFGEGCSIFRSHLSQRGIGRSTNLPMCTYRPSRRQFRQPGITFEVYSTFAGAPWQSERQILKGCFRTAMGPAAGERARASKQSRKCSRAIAKSLHHPQQPKPDCPEVLNLY